MKTHKLEDVINEFIGKQGTPKRDVFDDRVKVNLLGFEIKDARIKRNLTQQQLGELVGVQKAQISKLEKDCSSASLKTLVKVFRALNVRLNIQVEFLEDKSKVA